jgi:prevent-host-death family protein
MTHIGSFEAKTHLPALLTRVEKGEEIIITRRGKAVARLTAFAPSASFDEKRTQHIHKAIANIKKLRAQVHKRNKRLGLPPVTQEEILSWKNKGRP